MGAFRIEIRGIHFLHVECAFALRGVAGDARVSSIFVVPIVARDATESLLHAGRGAIVPCPHLRTPAVRGGNASGVPIRQFSMRLVAAAAAVMLSTITRFSRVVANGNLEMDIGQQSK